MTPLRLHPLLIVVIVGGLLNRGALAGEPDPHAVAAALSLCPAGMSPCCVGPASAPQLTAQTNVFLCHDWAALGHLPRDIGYYAQLVAIGIDIPHVVLVGGIQGRSDMRAQWEILRPWFVTAHAAFGTGPVTVEQHDGPHRICTTGLILAMPSPERPGSADVLPVTLQYPKWFGQQGVAFPFRLALWRSLGLPAQEPAGWLGCCGRRNTAHILLVQRYALKRDRMFDGMDAFEKSLLTRYKGLVTVNRTSLSGSYASQAAELQLADIVIMAHGAAVASAVTMRPMAGLIECFPAGFRWGYFAPLLEQFGVRHRIWTATKAVPDCHCAVNTPAIAGSTTCRSCAIALDFDQSIVDALDDLLIPLMAAEPPLSGLAGTTVHGRIFEPTL